MLFYILFSKYFCRKNCFEIKTYHGLLKLLYIIGTRISIDKSIPIFVTICID